MKRLVILASIVVASCALAGCSSPDASRLEGQPPNGVGPNGEDPASAAAAVTCVSTAKPHVGLGGDDLNNKRLEGQAGADRRRAKAYEMLGPELARVLGSAPASMARLGATFGAAKERWYAEPEPSAITMSSMLDVAFEGCVTLTATDPKYGNAPEASTALAACSMMARTFWSRVVTAADVQGCVDVAMLDSAKETYASGADGAPMTTDTTPRRRWAYACASLLTTTQFLAY